MVSTYKIVAFSIKIANYTAKISRRNMALAGLKRMLEANFSYNRTTETDQPL